MGAGFDAELQRFVVGHRADWLDPVAIALSDVGSLGLIWVFGAVILSALRRSLGPVVVVVLAVAAADLLATLLKLAVRRDRPYVAFPEQEPLMRAVLDLSFPSGHAATAFAGATVLTALLPRTRALPLFLLAAAVAWSRVYVGVHYVTDVLAGAALGVVIALLLLAASRRLSPRAQRAG